MAKGIKELTALEAMSGDLRFETVGGVADEEGIYARQVKFSEMEAWLLDVGRTDAPVPVRVKLAETKAEDDLLNAVVSGKSAAYFGEGLPSELASGAATSVVKAIAKEHGLLGKIVRDGGAGDEYLSLLPAALKGEGVSLVSAIRAEYERATAREGAGAVPEIYENLFNPALQSLKNPGVPVDFIDAFGDVKTKLADIDWQDGQQSARLVSIENIIGEESSLPAPVESLAQNINRLFRGEFEDKAVAAVKLADKAVAAIKLADEAVETAKIADGAVTEDKIAGGAVTAAKLTVAAIESETGVRAGGAVTEDNIAGGAVTAAMLTVAAIVSVSVDRAVGEVTEDKIAEGAVTAAKLTVAAIESETGDLAD
ncbi:MAG: hypothetical protein LBK61_06160, partial [Spirochaetaceae bacterium]|nr:hypothetical protein [Spirochaetaceae bacterium]